MNIRRTIAAAAAAGALILTPIAAVAAPADTDYTGSAPAEAVVGQSFPVTIDGAEPGEDVTLTVTYDDPVTDADITIAGTKSHTKAANADGVAAFTVTIASPGTVQLEAVGAESGTLFSDTVQVGESVTAEVEAGDDGEGSGPAGGDKTSGGDKAAGGKSLSDSGAPAGVYAAGAGLLLLAGAFALVGVKRRAGQSN